MSELEAGDADPTSEPAPSERPVVHHGEAMVAALLNPQSVPATAPESGTPTPLTAAAVLGTTPLAPATAETVLGTLPSESEDPDEPITPPAAHEEPPAPAAAGGDGGDDAGDGGDDEGDDDERSERAIFARNILEWMVVLFAAALVAVLLRTFVFQAFFIPSESMETTLFENDRILVNKVSYRLHDVNRGDVVVFRRPDDQPGEIRDLIKRVIALPGETIEGRDSQIYINDQLLIEPYLDGNRFGDFGPTEVPEGELFMMGDNRDQSLDSRRFGTIEDDRIVGRAFFLFWPFDRVGSL